MFKISVGKAGKGGPTGAQRRGPRARRRPDRRMPLQAVMMSIMAVAASPGARAAPPPPAVTAEVTILTLDGARIALDAAERWARANGLKVSLAVVDTSGTLLALARMDGAMTVSVDNAIVKARTAAQLGRPSMALQEQVDKGRVSLLAVQGISPMQGGIPLIAGKVLVGGIGASGASAQQDEDISRQGAAALAEAASR